ncbi:heavy metal translocating P-type ATPase [Acinetobacter sp. SAAs470]|uniref:heavy metal translocating P-type ATPase n=1 Tax=unclassified Acinetobacter TaxID=196816 RepID=UPI003977DB1C
MTSQKQVSNQVDKNQSISLAAVDPVCGMIVKDPVMYEIDYAHQHYAFCSEGCRTKFLAHPEQYQITDLDEVSEISGHQSCCNQVHDQQQNEPKVIESVQATDPVCGMVIDQSTRFTTSDQYQHYYFCSASCLEKFKADPARYAIPIQQRLVPEGAAELDYTCPMDPEIIQKGPGVCPICGMALEPMQPTLNDHPNPELVDFSHRFWRTLPFTVIVFILAMTSHMYAVIPQHIQPWIELILSLPVVIWAGKPILQRCFISYKTFKLNMWSLIGVGVLAAFLYSIVATLFPTFIPIQAKTAHGVAVYFEAACMIVSLSLLGQMMELKARSKTADSLKSLLKLQPTTATLLRAGQPVEVDIAVIQKGDILQIASGEQIPLDGIVREGTTYVDEAMMTGEPVPVKKQQGDTVIGGTINQQGSIRIETTAVGTHTTLAKMIQTVAEAQRSKAPLQRLADRVAQYFVVIVLLVSILTFALWILLAQAPFNLALMCAVSVLIVACPCALGLATPMSVMATTGRAAQRGVLFKDAQSIETLSKATTLIIDKTGTLTEGKPSLNEIKVLVPQIDQKQIELWIASLEQFSTHPIAQTLAKIIPAQHYVKVDHFEDMTGFGVKGEIEGITVYVGSQKLLEQLGIVLAEDQQLHINILRQRGEVISFLATSNEVLAYISIHDAIKYNTCQVIDLLMADGIEVIMASGDHEQNAKLVAQEVGIEHVYANCNPQDKLELVKKYQAQGKVVVMAGDGINDAPALAQADIGIAMGNGTDIAKQTAQVTLVKGDVRGIADAIHMAKLGVRNMKQNLAFSFVYNGLGVPVAAGIFYPFIGLLLTPMFAAVAMSLSSLSVVLNALRLQKMK